MNNKMPKDVTELGTLKVRVLEFKQDSFPDKATGKEVAYTKFYVRTPVGMMKIRPVGGFDFTPYVDKDIELLVGLSIFNMQPNLCAYGIKSK